MHTTHQRETAVLNQPPSPAEAAFEFEPGKKHPRVVGRNHPATTSRRRARVSGVRRLQFEWHDEEARELLSVACGRQGCLARRNDPNPHVLGSR
jgi:hypothetical protein